MLFAVVPVDIITNYVPQPKKAKTIHLHKKLMMDAIKSNFMLPNKHFQHS